MISTGELKKGVVIELDNELWQILDYHHIKMGRGSAQVRITVNGRSEKPAARTRSISSSAQSVIALLRATCAAR